MYPAILTGTHASSFDAVHAGTGTRSAQTVLCVKTGRVGDGAFYIIVRYFSSCDHNTFVLCSIYGTYRLIELFELFWYFLCKHMFRR